MSLNEVTNPTSTGSTSTSVSTTSDTKAATASVTLTPANSVKSVSATSTSTAAGAKADWTVGFTTSATGGIPAADGSVSVTLPSGTELGSSNTDTCVVTDTTTSNIVSEGNFSTSGTTETCSFNTGSGVIAGNVLSVALNAVTNTTTTGSASVSVVTSADTKAATASVSITTANAVSGLTVVPSSTAAGAQTTWTANFTTSATGALEYSADSAVTITLPTGTTFASFQGGTVTDTTTGDPLSDSCSNTSGTTVTCSNNYGYNSAAGDVLSVVLTGLTNPNVNATTTTNVSTTSDTKAATASVIIGQIPTLPCAKISGKATGEIKISKCLPKTKQDKLARGLASSLFSGGTFTWSKSNQTTVVATTVTSPGQGSCSAKHTEEDVSGTATGGTSTYTTPGSPVSIRLCESHSGSLKLLKGSIANI